MSLRILIAALLTALIALSGVPRAQLSLTGAGAAGGAGTGSCSQSSAWFARATSLDTAHHNAYDDLICGGVTDGWWANLSSNALWILRTNSLNNAILNLANSSFTLSVQGSVTFVADSGVTSDGSTGYYKTGYTLGSSGALTQNSGALAACPTATANVTENSIGALNGAGTVADEIVEVGGSSVTLGFLSNVTGASVGTTSAHLWMISRTSSTLATLYEDGTAQATDSTASVGNPGLEAYVLARNNNGTADNFTAHQHVMAMIGSGFTSTDANNFRSRISTYMATIGGAAC
jgi:hypothetical protein